MRRTLLSRRKDQFLENGPFKIWLWALFESISSVNYMLETECKIVEKLKYLRPIFGLIMKTWVT